MAHTLFICAIPIGHPDDITLRVRSCLSTVSVIFCEDTRLAQRFLSDQGLWQGQSLVRMDQHQENLSFRAFDRDIAQHDVAYITDAGSPNISDPGARLVAHARAQGVSVTVLSGISAITAFLSGVGVICSSFYFGGFLPKKSGDRLVELSHVLSKKWVGVWFESPQRIQATMDDILAIDSNIQVAVAKELTKPYEQFLIGPVITVSEALQAMDTRGEWVVMVDAQNYREPLDDSMSVLAKSLKDLGIMAHQIKPLAGLFNVNKNDLYRWFIQS